MLYSKQMLHDLSTFMTIREVRIQLLKIGRRRHRFKTLGLSTIYRWMNNEAFPGRFYKDAVVQLYQEKIVELEQTKKAFNDQSREFGSIPKRNNSEPINFF